MSLRAHNLEKKPVQTGWFLDTSPADTTLKHCSSQHTPRNATQYIHIISGREYCAFLNKIAEQLLSHYHKSDRGTPGHTSSAMRTSPSFLQNLMMSTRFSYVSTAPVGFPGLMMTIARATIPLALASLMDRSSSATVKTHPLLSSA